MSAASEPVLQATGVSVSYGGLNALTDVDVSVAEGQLVALIGPNGAGKTTFIDAITGFTPMAGEVTLRGTSVTSLSAHERARRGLARTWQGAGLFDDLTVADNLHVASSDAHAPWRRLRSRLGRAARQERDDVVAATLARLGIEQLADLHPDQLTQGQRKLVGVARALAEAPAVLCLDEPAAGLDTDESAALGRRLRRLVDDGIPILLIDHDMSLVLEVSDFVVVLDFGRVIAADVPARIRENQAVTAAYLGGTAVVDEEAGG